MNQLDDGAMLLRDGNSVWQAFPDTSHVRGRAEVLKADVVIIGAGVTGAFMAERLTRDGHSVVLVDRHAPATGSTAASTAMLLWELDSSLLELEDRFGFDATALISSACRKQVMTIGELVSGLRIACDFAFRPSLYLAGNKLDEADLREEHRLRARIGIDGVCLNADALAGWGFVGDNALLYPFSAEVDPVKLTRGLLAVAQARGARIVWPATALVYETVRDGVCVETREGDIIRARKLVLANGYEMPEFVPGARHKVVSTWAFATEPRTSTSWPNGALVWEASDPYLYMRRTADGRVIVGGADEPDVGDVERGKLTSTKMAELHAAASARFPELRGAASAFTWSGAFGQTEDSLPFIGPVPGKQDCLAAYGYGGNGITFSALAAELLAANLAGQTSPLARFCALDRA
jgi:glycine/D-amino acid oxidase-like deaminating enzyme